MALEQFWRQKDVKERVKREPEHHSNAPTINCSGYCHQLDQTTKIRVRRTVQQYA